MKFKRQYSNVFCACPCDQGDEFACRAQALRRFLSGPITALGRYTGNALKDKLLQREQVAFVNA